LEEPVFTFLDLAQRWMFSEFQVDEKERVKIRRTIIGPLRTTGDQSSTIPMWAPAWWHGDEDATASNMAAMKALRR
jgi:hypothetical protein